LVTLGKYYYIHFFLQKLIFYTNFEKVELHYCLHYIVLFFLPIKVIQCLTKNSLRVFLKYWRPFFIYLLLLIKHFLQFWRLSSSTNFVVFLNFRFYLTTNFQHGRANVHVFELAFRLETFVNKLLKWLPYSKPYIRMIQFWY